MKIAHIQNLAIPEVKVIGYQRFADERGYFSETFRVSDLAASKDLGSLAKANFTQGNESFSKANVIRGFHFQWNPYMGKLVRPLFGRLIDIAIDIRIGSPTFGKAVGAELPARGEDDTGSWIWVPPGFAHGIYLPEDSLIEYLCTGQYSPGCEAGISPLAEDIDWSLCDESIKNKFLAALPKAIISPKDRAAFNLKSWSEDEKSKNFVYGKL